MTDRSGRIRAGMGGWNYEPWRETFYPGDVTKKGELAYASRQVTAIEVNGTFYRLQTPAVFAKWRDETPDDFVFTLKAPRFITNRRVLREAEAFVPRFLASGLSELGPKLGPLLWQLAPTKAFEPDDVAGFLRLLPKELDGLRLRHAFEVRHDSFMTPDYLALAREHGVATVFADTDEHPSFADVTGDFVYARLRRTVSTEPTGYTKKALRAWAERAHMGRRQRACGSAASGETGRENSSPRRLYVLHQRRQGTRARRGDAPAVPDRQTHRTETGSHCSQPAVAVGRARRQEALTSSRN